MVQKNKGDLQYRKCNTTNHRHSIKKWTAVSWHLRPNKCQLDKDKFHEACWWICFTQLTFISLWMSSDSSKMLMFTYPIIHLSFLKNNLNYKFLFSRSCTYNAGNSQKPSIVPHLNKNNYRIWWRHNADTSFWRKEIVLDDNAIFLIMVI